MRLHIPTANELILLLVKPLDRDIDSLRVAEVVPGNRRKWGQDKLES